jgi:hypothetical protein
VMQWRPASSPNRMAINADVSTTTVAEWKPACNFDPLTGEIGVQF